MAEYVPQTDPQPGTSAQSGQCKTCHAHFSTQSNLKAHIKEVHLKIKRNVIRHSCELCASSFSSGYNLAKHVERFHLNIQVKFIQYAD